MADLDLTFVSTARIHERVMHDLFIMIDDVEFNVEDLRELLAAVEDNDAIISPDAAQGQILLKNEVLGRFGSYFWGAGATKGSNFDAFKQALDDLLKKHHPAYN